MRSFSHETHLHFSIFTCLLQNEIKMSCWTTICRWIANGLIRIRQQSLKYANLFFFFVCCFLSFFLCLVWNVWVIERIRFSFLLFSILVLDSISIARVQKKNFNNVPKTCTSWERPLGYNFYFHGKCDSTLQTIPTMAFRWANKMNLKTKQNIGRWIESREKKKKKTKPSVWRSLRFWIIYLTKVP